MRNRLANGFVGESRRAGLIADVAPCLDNTGSGVSSAIDLMCDAGGFGSSGIWVSVFQDVGPWYYALASSGGLAFRADQIEIPRGHSCPCFVGERRVVPCNRISIVAAKPLLVE